MKTRPLRCVFQRIVSDLVASGDPVKVDGRPQTFDQTEEAGVAVGKRRDVVEENHSAGPGRRLQTHSDTTQNGNV